MKNLILFFSLVLLLSCSDNNSINSGDIGGSGNNGNSNDDIDVTDSWLIEKSLVFDGGPGKDGIPALVNPEMIGADEVDYILDDDLVIGLKYGNKVVAYPHKILDWHEIINDDIDDMSLAITYCPLTGTAVGWNRNINNTNTTFGVSGLLYKNNLIPYDRSSDSNWSQLKLECVNGKLIGSKPDITILREMRWNLWKKIYPQTRVVSTNTGHQRTYSRYPYGDYKTNNQYFIFPNDPVVNNIPEKERVHVIILDDIAKVYRFSDFGSGKVIRDTFKNKQLIIIGNPDFIVSFELNANTNILDFEYNFNGSEIILTDNENNTWNLFGEAISGPREGTFLDTAKISMMAYYFSVESFYPNPIIF